MGLDISIVTVVFNDVANIERTLNSVIGQSYKNIQYIVVDGKSHDGTVEVLGRYKEKIGTIISELDEGIADAFNKALKNITGEFVVFLNSGDVFVNEHSVSEMVDRILSLETADLYYGNAICRVGTKPMFRMKSSDVMEDSLIHPFVNHQALFARRHLFDKIGGFDKRLQFGMDYDWMLRCYFAGAVFQAVDIDLVYYLLGGKSDQYIVKALNECRSVALSYGFNALVVNALYKKKIRRARIQNILNSVGLGKVSLRLKGFLKTKYEIV